MTEASGSGRGKLFAVRLGLGLASAALIGSYAWYPSLALLPYVALVPWIVLYTDERTPRASLGWFVLTSWIAVMLEYPQPFRMVWFAGPLFALPFAVPWWLFAPALRTIHQRLGLPRALTVPLVWTAVEWVRTTYALAHFDLYSLGYSQARWPCAVQIADVTGVYGVTFLIAAVNGLIADAFFALRGGAWSFTALRARRIVVPAVAIGVAFAIVLGYGAVRCAGIKDERGPRVALVQPCTSHTPGNALGDHLRQVLLTDKSVPAGGAELIVWPENAVLDNIRREGFYLDDLTWLGETKRAYMLVGGMNWPVDRPGTKRNGAFLIGPPGRIAGEYDKQVLFPFTEYVPGDGFLARFAPNVQKRYRSMIRTAWGSAARAVPGEHMVLFHIPWNGGDLPFAALICSENTYPPVPAAAGRLGARFFVNITSEGNMGAPVQEQLMRISMLRAIENRIAYVRVGNTGISGIIDAAGRVRSVLRGESGSTILEPGVLIDRIPLSSGGITWYARSRDAFGRLCVAAATVLLLVALFGRSRAGAIAVVAGAALLAAGCADAPVSRGDPVSAAAALERGRALYQRGQAAAALSELTRACADPGACRTAILYAEECFKQTRQIESAIDFFGAVAARYPELAPIAGGSRGVFLERLGDFVEAEQEYRRSIARTPTTRVCSLLAELLLRRDDLPEAVEAARQASALEPDDADAGALYARTLRRAGRSDDARRALDAALAAHPDSAPVWVEVGRLRLSQGDSAGAAAAFTRAAADDPSSTEPRFFLARIALREGKRDEAERALDDIEKIQSENARARGGTR